MAEFIQSGGTGGGSYARYYTAKLTVWEKPWDSSTNLPYSIEENKSRVGRKLELISGSSGRFSDYTIGWGINVDGQTNSGSGNQSLMSYNTSLTLYEDEIIVEHNEDGKKTVSCSASISSSGTYSPGNFSMSGELELTTIPRASKAFATNADIGSSSTITINKASSSFTHTLEYSFEGLTGTIIEKTSQESVGWEVPKSFFQKIPESQDGTVTITCKTYSGNTLIGTSQTTMTAKVPTSGENSSMPIIESATAVDTNPDTIELTGNSSRLVKYFSKVRLNATGRCLDYAGLKVFREMSIYELTSTTTESNGITQIEATKLYDSFTKDYFRLNLVDTRGLISQEKILNEENGDFVIVPYIPLTMKADIERQSETSNSIKMNFTGNFYNGYFDENNTNFNNLTIKWRYKLTDIGSWITEGADDTTNGWHNLTLNTDFKYDEGKNSYQSNGDIVISDLFDYQKKYTVEINYSDELSSYSVQKPLPEGTPNHDYGVDSEGNNFFNVNGNYFKNGEPLIMQACNINETVGKAYTSGEKITFKSERYNNSNGKIVFEDNGLITVNHTGYIKVSFNVWIFGESNARPWAQFYDYTNKIKYIDVIDDISNNYVCLGVANCIIPVTKGQQFTLQVVSNTGFFDIDKNNDKNTSYMTIELI